MHVIHDVMFWREAMTVLAFVIFVSIVLWAWSARRSEEFDQAGRSVIDDNDLHPEMAGRANPVLVPVRVTMRGSHE